MMAKSTRPSAECFRRVSGFSRILESGSNLTSRSRSGIPLASWATSGQYNDVREVDQKATGAEAAWLRVSSRLDRMTPEQRRQTLVSAGILTERGNVRAPYKEVFSEKENVPKVS